MDETAWAVGERLSGDSVSLERERERSGTRVSCGLIKSGGVCVCVHVLLIICFIDLTHTH